MRLCVFIFIFFLRNSSLNCQIQKVSGTLVSERDNSLISGVVIHIENTIWTTGTNADGVFILEGKLPLGEQIIHINKQGFVVKRIPIIINLNQTLSLGNITLLEDSLLLNQNFDTIDLTDNQLLSNDDTSNNQALLQSSKDVFSNSVAFNWSAVFFKVRGLGNEYSEVFLNGVKMNKTYNNRPNWSNWSGLNDILRSREATTYLNSNPYSFGDVLGVTNFKINSSIFSKGKKVSFSSTNKSYQGRLMATYHSGLNPKGWAYSISASGTSAKQGYIEGTSLKAVSLFASIEKQINDKHSLSLTSIYASVKRGKSSPNTNEVIGIKGIRYNSYWGYQNGKIRNSRIKRVQEPIITLTHFWKANSKVEIQNNVLFQTGQIGNSRIDFNGKSIEQGAGQTFFVGGGRNPSPSYYQTLPNYFLRSKDNEDYEAAFLSDRNFRNNGQLDWNSLYEANRNSNGNSNYILYEDRNDDTLLACNSILDYNFSEQLNFQAKIAYQGVKSKNFAEVTDLLGGKGYLDIEPFSEGNKAQNNLQKPNRIVEVGDDFKYNYDLKSSNINSFLQFNYEYNKWNLNLGIQGDKVTFQRIGKYENGYYPKNLSIGKSKKIAFIGYGLKLGIQHQLTNKLFLKTSLLAKSRAPLLKYVFVNPRQNNNEVKNLSNEKLLASDASLFYQFGAIKSRLSAYWIQRNNGTNNSFFFTDNLAGQGRVENAGFFQEVTTGVNTNNIGLEFGAEITITSTLAINTSIAIGNHKYTNNPNLQISSNNFPETINAGKTFLKNYHLSTGPQQAYGVGFSYRDPAYWWFITQLNYFANSYNSISPFIRTQNFVTDIDGMPFQDFEEKRAEQLLGQEKFSNYFLWNAIGGKSWKIKKNYLGIIIGVQNILNQIYRTGGFEQTRNSNFKTLNEDSSRENPLFGSKYWHGSGTTFYVNTYYRF